MSYFKRLFYVVVVFITIIVLTISCFGGKDKPPITNFTVNKADANVQNTVFSTELSAQNVGPDDAPTLGEVGKINITQANGHDWYQVDLGSVKK